MHLADLEIDRCVLRLSQTLSFGRRGNSVAERMLVSVLRSVAVGPARRIVVRLLRDPGIRAEVLHMLSDQVAMQEASFEHDMPARLDEIRGFEDLVWLFNSNPLNHGIARLRLDEAAYLYRLVASYPEPDVVELGTYKGGSAFLMAAAGGRVMTMDNGRLPGHERFVPELVRALVRVGLNQQVQIVEGDARRYPVAPNSFDVVFFDCMYSYVTTRTIFEQWWPAVRPNGALLFRDGKHSRLTEAVRFVSELDPESIGATVDRSAPGSFVLLRKRPGIRAVDRAIDEATSDSDQGT